MKQFDIKDINILVICTESEAVLYETHLKSLCVKYYTLSSSHQIENIPQIIPINGVLIDVATFSSFTEEEKAIVREMEKIYPFARIKKNSDTAITLMHKDSGIDTIDDFIEKKARYFDPRIMRNSTRKEVFLNVTISDTIDFTGIQEKTCTQNISDTGFFIITSAQGWKENQKIFIVINELKHKTPVEGTIIRKINWGELLYTPPGISIRIDSIFDSQQDELMSLQ
jgi:hypothetical protein